MLAKNELEQVLRTNLPTELDDQAPVLALAILDSMNDPRKASIVPSQETQKALLALAGQQLTLNDAVISFGEGAQIGDIMVRDVAGRDIVHITINIIYNSTSAASNTPRLSLNTLSRQEFRQILVDRFSLNELRDLCFELNIDHENLPAQSKGSLALELITYSERRGRYDELVQKARKMRPDIS